MMKKYNVPKDDYHIYENHQIYNGFESVNLPDLVITVRHNNDSAGTINSPEPITNIKAGAGCHSPKGIFYITAPDGIINKNSNLSEIGIQNILPNILYYMGMDLPKDLDGNVEKGIFASEYMNNNPVKYSDQAANDSHYRDYSYSENDNRSIEENLKSLGYID